MSVEWEAWFARIEQQPTPQEKYTATLLKTLHRLVETAPFDWALTGGTALQSLFPVERRRYSTDIEIVTTASRTQVLAWLGPDAAQARPVNDRILVVPLTPDGQLFIIHDYPAEDLAAARPSPVTFEHYPFSRDPPPGKLTVPMLSRAFLVATKIFGIQQDDRGAERSKDANDLAISLAMIDSDQAVLDALGVYVRHRKYRQPDTEVIRSAGSWLEYFAGPGYPAFERWHKRMSPPNSKPPSMDELKEAKKIHERLLGKPIEASPAELRRRLLYSVRIKDVADVAKRAGYRGHLGKELEKMYDFIGRAILPRLQGPAPTNPEELLREVRQAT